MHELAEWDSFYLIVGAAAGALIGLQFVVMTLIADRPKPVGKEVADAFATPTTIHFAVAFLLSAVVRVPWKEVTSAAASWGLIGFIGIVYSLVVVNRMRSQETYKPVFEDWLFHCILPLASYVLLAVSAFYASSYAHEALFGVGAATLLLLFIGIHNAWDTVTYNVFTIKPREAKESTTTSSENTEDD
jgi:hypothetical protein